MGHRERSMNNFKVFVLGAAGSGKTAFLASMYESLSTESKDLGFHLCTVKEEDSKALIRKYQELVNPETPWPPGTTNICEWHFHCNNWSSGQCLFKFSYLDFPGGFLTDNIAYEEDEQRLANEFSNANSVLVLLDGEKLYYFMRNLKPPTQTSLDLELELRFILPKINTIAKGVPVHFVITKWDILENHFTLTEIRQKLLAIEKFRDIVNLRKNETIPTRLLPVSALGKGIAKLDEQGRMTKCHNNVDAKPMHVELSIIYTLFDGFAVALKNTKEKKTLLQTNKKNLLAMLLFLILSLFRLFSRGATHMAHTLQPPYNFGVSATSLLISSVTKRLEKTHKEISAEINMISKSITDQESALDQVIKKCKIAFLKFERKYPDSILIE
jgi:GTPase SAR1 family protein